MRLRLGSGPGADLFGESIRRGRLTRQPARFNCARNVSKAGLSLFFSSESAARTSGANGAPGVFLCLRDEAGQRINVVDDVGDVDV